MLFVQDVTKRYGKVLANDHISFDVGDGKIAVLLGPNGAGKSTMIKCIAGLLRFEGTITLGGFSNKSLEAKSLLGYVPEIPAVYDLLTVWEHLEFIARAYKLPAGWEEDARQLVERFEMTENLKKLGKELSKGMQQKVSILCALVSKPKMIILDEPMVGLDPHAIKELKLMFRELRAAGTTLLISTHMIEMVEDNWDVAHIMIGGRIAATRISGQTHADGKTLEQLFFEITERRPEDNA